MAGSAGPAARPASHIFRPDVRAEIESREARRKKLRGRLLTHRVFSVRGQCWRVAADGPAEGGAVSGDVQVGFVPGLVGTASAVVSRSQPAAVMSVRAGRRTTAHSGTEATPAQPPLSLCAAACSSGLAALRGNVLQ